MFQTRGFSAVDVVPGRAVFLRPSELRATMLEMLGDTFFLPNLDDHYFVIVDLLPDGDRIWAAIVPTTSHPNGRAWIPVCGKYGHPQWRDNPTFADPRQVWPVPVQALVAAARAAGDASSRQAPNGISGRALGELLAAIGFHRVGDGYGPNVAEMFRRLFWAKYRSGEIWDEIRRDAVYLGPRRVQFRTGRD